MPQIIRTVPTYFYSIFVACKIKFVRETKKRRNEVMVIVHRNTHARIEDTRTHTNKIFEHTQAHYA